MEAAAAVLKAGAALPGYKVLAVNAFYGCRVVGIAGLVLLLPLLWEVLKEGIKSEVNEK